MKITLKHIGNCLVLFTLALICLPVNAQDANIQQKKKDKGEELINLEVLEVKVLTESELRNLKKQELAEVLDQIKGSQVEHQDEIEKLELKHKKMGMIEAELQEKVDKGEFEEEDIQGRMEHLEKRKYEMKSAISVHKKKLGILNSNIELLMVKQQNN